MTRDVPDKSRETEDMHQIEHVHEIMETQREIEDILDFSSEDDSSDRVVRTIATNTTR